VDIREYQYEERWQEASKEDGMVAIRTLVVDGDASFCQQVKSLLASEPDIEVIGEAADGEEAVLKARELKPDVVLMDVRMPRLSGLNAALQLKAEMPEIRVIMLSVFDLQEYREAAMVSGASAYVVKRHMFDELVPAIRGGS